MPYLPFIFLILTTTAAPQGDQDDSCPSSVLLLQTGAGLAGVGEEAKARLPKQSPADAYDFIHDDNDPFAGTTQRRTTPQPTTTPAPAPPPPPPPPPAPPPASSGTGSGSGATGARSRSAGSSGGSGGRANSGSRANSGGAGGSAGDAGGAGGDADSGNAAAKEGSIRGHEFSTKAFLAEYIAMIFFVFIGCGTAMAIARDVGSAWILQVSFAFGLAISVLIYGMARYSGGQLNCAVTFALWVCGHIGWLQALTNFAAQMAGSVTGAIFLSFVFSRNMDKTGNIGSNVVSEEFSTAGVFLGELVMTFVLCMTVLESSLQSGPALGIAVLPIGFAVFLAHVVLIPMDGCSINPTRSFGPALVASCRDGKGDHFKDHVIFWLAPLAGALAASAIHTALN